VRLAAHVLCPGEASGPLLVLAEPLSFWGGFDPRTGVILDTHHPQCGLRISGSILLMPQTRGSGSAPGALAEAIRCRTAPLGIVLRRRDVNLAIGSIVAGSLYGTACPILTLESGGYGRLASQSRATIAPDGTITAE
jgi:predicted aconitase with swiveling domain